MFITQEYSRYTAEEHAVWATLCARRMATLPETGSRAFLRGLELLNIDMERLPRLTEINERLQPLTGFRAVAVDGYLPAREFFTCLAERSFPTTITVRPREQLDYLPEPDIFHDVFGHVPLHTDPYLADFLQRFGQAGLAAETEEELTGLSRLFWFTVEFGLIREGGEGEGSGATGPTPTPNGRRALDGAAKRTSDAERPSRLRRPAPTLERRIKLFGSGLMSSPGEGAHALTDAVEKRDFDLHEVMRQPFEIDHYQPLLYVIDSFEQLYHAMDERARELERRPVLR
jgi:phenylalanine-4-hydroxylase